MTLDFCCDMQMVGSDGINSMNSSAEANLAIGKGLKPPEAKGPLKIYSSYGATSVTRSNTNRTFGM